MKQNEGRKHGEALEIEKGSDVKLEMIMEVVKNLKQKIDAMEKEMAIMEKDIYNNHRKIKDVEDITLKSLLERRIMLKIKDIILNEKKSFEDKLREVNELVGYKLIMEEITNLFALLHNNRNNAIGNFRDLFGKTRVIEIVNNMADKIIDREILKNMISFNTEEKKEIAKHPFTEINKHPFTDIVNHELDMEKLTNDILNRKIINGEMFEDEAKLQLTREIGNHMADAMRYNCRYAFGGMPKKEEKQVVAEKGRTWGERIYYILFAIFIIIFAIYFTK